MGLPTVTLTWDFSKINQRRANSALNDQTSFVFFTAWRYWIDTLGWTVKYTCNGTTGPTSAGDHTDRLTTQASCTTRATVAAAAQSFGVATDGAGVDHLLTYLGATDDTFTYTASPGGLFTPAATSTNEPTATDAVIVMAGLSLVGGGAGDRVTSMAGSIDKKNFRLWVYTGGVLAREFWIERCASTVIGSLAWTDPLVVGNMGAQAGTAAFGTAGNNVIGASNGGAQGSTGNAYARIANQIAVVNGGAELYNGSTRVNQGVNNFLTANCELNGGGPIVPTVFASTTTFVEGKLGNRVDSWFPFVTGITDNTWFGTNFNYMYLNTRLVPWDGANPLIIA